MSLVVASFGVKCVVAVGSSKLRIGWIVRTQVQMFRPRGQKVCAWPWLCRAPQVAPQRRAANH
jgi:hypothetical protein